MTANSRRAFTPLAFDHNIARPLNHVLQTGLIAVLTNTVLDTAEINAEFNRGFAGARNFFTRARDFFARARDFFARAGDFFARARDFFAGARDFFARARNFFAGAGDFFAGARDFFARARDFFARARDFFARAGDFFAGAGGFRFCTARRFNPPPGVNCSIVNPQITNFATIRIELIALACSHVVKTRIEALAVVVARAVYEFNALGSNNNFARAGNRFSGARRNNFARAGCRFFGTGRSNFARARCRFFGTGRSNFTRARSRRNTGAGYFNRTGRCRSFNAGCFDPPPCLGYNVVNPLRIFRLAIRIHSITLALFHVFKAGIIAMFAIMTCSVHKRNASGAVLGKSHSRGYAQEQ